MIRPQLRFFIEGRYSRHRRTPLRTFTSKNLRQSSSGISSKDTGSKIPKLFTKISTSGYIIYNLFAASAFERSPANPKSCPVAVAPNSEMALSTDSSERPLMIVWAPSIDSALAIASPMPAVLPVISAILSLICRCIITPF